MLHQLLWDKALAGAAYSATLRSLGNFDMFIRNVGLNLGRAHDTGHFLSDFPYSESRIYIAAGGVNPNHEDHPAITARAVIGAAEKNSGGILGLFTSRRYMDRVLELLQEMRPDIAGLVLAQGNHSKSRIIESHRKRIAKGEKSIIFGLASFAEGVDLPGNLCNVVIIPRVPFAVPDTPIENKRMEWIKQSGGNPFYDHTLPSASVRLTQMIGRLIRDLLDRGHIIILDNRIHGKSYGRLLAMNWPPFTIVPFDMRQYAERRAA